MIDDNVRYDGGDEDVDHNAALDDGLGVAPLHNGLKDRGANTWEQYKFGCTRLRHIDDIWPVIDKCKLMFTQLNFDGKQVNNFVSLMADILNKSAVQFAEYRSELIDRADQLKSAQQKLAPHKRKRKKT